MDVPAREIKGFLSVGSRSGARYFLKDGVTPYAPGDHFAQPDLAAALRQVASDGYETFYRGEIGECIDADMRKHRGFLRADETTRKNTRRQSQPGSSQ